MAPEKPENPEEQPPSTDSQPTDDAQTPADAQPAAESPAANADQSDAADTEAPDQKKASTSDAAADAAAQDPAPDDGAQAPELPDFAAVPTAQAESTIEMLSDVDLDVKIELGRAEMTVEEILRLTNGSVVELDRLAGDPVDIMVNEKLIARGEVLVVNDNFCVRINEIVKGIGQQIAEASQT